MWNMIRKFVAVALVTFIVLVMSDSASAHGYGGHHHGYGYNSGSLSIIFGNDYRGYRSMWGRHGHYGHRHGGHQGSNSAAWALVGAVVGYRIGSTASQPRYPQHVYAQPRQVVYVRPVQSQVYVQPQTPSFSCKHQDREYTTKVQVGGKTVSAYGRACWQPDGSWRPYGPLNYVQ